MGEAGYSFSLTTFSPSGKLLQIEHALKAVQGGKASLGIQGACARAQARALPAAFAPEPFHCSLATTCTTHAPCSQDWRSHCHGEEALVHAD